VSSCLRGKKKICVLRESFAPLRLKNSATGRKLNNRKLGVFMPSWQKKTLRTSRNLCVFAVKKKKDARSKRKEIGSPDTHF
jgi:hypothetical protein